MNPDETQGIFTTSSPLSYAEELTKQFYRWEQNGRGWSRFDHPVALEPPFRPFLRHSSAGSDFIDDGRKPTFLSSLFERATRVLDGVPPRIPFIQPEEEEATPDPVTRGPLNELQILLPPDFDASNEAFLPFLTSLSLCCEPLAFELIGVPGKVTPQFSVHTDDDARILSQLKAFFPEIGVLRRPNFLSNAWAAAESSEIVIGEFGLRSEFMYPLAKSKIDSFVALIGVLSDLREKESGVFQVLFEPVRQPWADHVLEAVTDDKGGSFFINAPDLLKQTRQKLSHSLYAVVVRVAAKSQSPKRAWEIMRNSAGALQIFSDPTCNGLIPLRNDNYLVTDHKIDLLRRQSRRCGMILNAEELVGLVHFPSTEVKSSKLTRLTKKSKPAPTITLNPNGLVLGENEHMGNIVTVALVPDQRVRHMHLVGASGTGKSTLLLNLIKQDLENGDGLAVLDPHGDLIERVLGTIPESRLNDVIFFDPSDEEFSIGFNFLAAHSELEKDLLASDLVSVFQRLSTSWGDQMTAVLGNAVSALLESSVGGTLLDLRRFLVQQDFRTSFLRTVNDQEVVYFWEKEFPLLAGKPQAPLLTRLNTFLRPKRIRFMVGQQESRFDLANIMDTGKIFLAKLAQGVIGEENAFLLGTLLVSKFHQMAISRQRLHESQRRDFWFYIDECHNFITPSVASLLSGIRKYRVGLILAHQEIRQLKRNVDVASAVLTNPFTRVCFRVGDEDARALAGGFSFFEAADLQNLSVGEAVLRVERATYDCNVKIPHSPSVDSHAVREKREKIIALSRTQYAAPFDIVEKEISRSHGFEARGNSPQSPQKPVATTGDKNEHADFESVLPTAASKIITITHPSVQSIEPTSRNNRLSELELRYLEAVITSPGKPSSAYAKLARVSGKRAIEIRRRLVAAGYFREHTIATGHRGAPAVVLEPFEPAYDAVNAKNQTNQ